MRSEKLDIEVSVDDVIARDQYHTRHALQFIVRIPTFHFYAEQPELDADITSVSNDLLSNLKRALSEALRKHNLNKVGIE